jgi:hypothetical protein
LKKTLLLGDVSDDDTSRAGKNGVKA